MGKFVDLKGKKYGKLTVLYKTSDKSKDNKIQWMCKCDCGNSIVVKGCNLTRNTRPTKSCGCLHRELNKTRGIKHNKRRSRLYSVWASMKQRCENKNGSSYKYYGARGIKLCDEWKNDFMCFYIWANNNGYDEKAIRGKCTIDRINNNGNYEPNNCRWVDMKVQSTNKRKIKNKGL